MILAIKHSYVLALVVRFMVRVNFGKRWLADAYGIDIRTTMWLTFGELWEFHKLIV